MDGEFAPIRYPWGVPPEEGQATEIAEGVMWMRIPLPMVLDHVNSYAFRERGGWTIVDTGLDTRRTRRLWQALIDGPLGGKPILRVLVTHHHPDHIGLAGWFQKELGAELWTTRTAWLTARMLVLDEQTVWPEETIAYYKSAGMAPAILTRRLRERPFNFCDMVAPLPLGYRRIQEGEVIRMGRRDWAVRMGNGHAPEHATLWSQDDNLVVGGDQLLASISPNIGVHPTEPEADPLAEWLEACERLAPFARDDQLVLPGHKLPFTGLPVRMRQLIENHHGALRRLEAHLSEPRIASACFSVLFAREITEKTYGLAMVEAMAHLNHLYQAGRITRVRRADGAWLWRKKG